MWVKNKLVKFSIQGNFYSEYYVENETLNPMRQAADISNVEMFMLAQDGHIFLLESDKNILFQFN